MIYREHFPLPPLAAFVNRFWYCENAVPAHSLERVMPSGAAAIVFALANDWLSQVSGPASTAIERGAPAVLVGARSQYETIVTADLARLAGIHFRPGGCRAFFSLPASEFGEVDLPLESLWGAFARDLRCRLMHAPSPEAIFSLLESALLPRLQVPGESDLLRQGVEVLQRAASAPAITQLAEDLGLTPKRLHRLFLDHVGLGPKRFFRIRRFRAALHLASLGKSVPWADIALQCGYYDQAHFINDFQAFSGVNPTTYFASRGPWIGHLAVSS